MILRHALKFQRFDRIGSPGKAPARSVSRRTPGMSFLNVSSRMMTASTEEAEVIGSSGDESMFRSLHGVTAKDADYDELARSVRDDEYAGIVDVIKEMAAQHLAAMWFVRSWSVDSALSD
jgi:hypothetical protein